MRTCNMSTCNMRTCNMRTYRGKNFRGTSKSKPCVCLDLGMFAIVTIVPFGGMRLRISRKMTRNKGV